MKLTLMNVKALKKAVKKAGEPKSTGEAGVYTGLSVERRPRGGSQTSGRSSCSVKRGSA